MHSLPKSVILSLKGSVFPCGAIVIFTWFWTARTGSGRSPGIPVAWMKFGFAGCWKLTGSWALPTSVTAATAGAWGRKPGRWRGEYGITYRTPLSPLCAQGHYGGFIGEKYENLSQYAAMVTQKRADGADFIKIMISGLMDFDRFGVLTEDGLPPETIRELIHIAHEEGFAVMAHANGARTVEAAALAGVDSVEHGAYLDTDALHAMRENGTVWVPTLSTIGNLRGTGRFDEAAVAAILESAMENVAAFAAMGGLIAPGTDAGAWAVPHGSLSEYALLEQVLGENAENILSRGAAEIQRKF